MIHDLTTQKGRNAYMKVQNKEIIEGAVYKPKSGIKNISDNDLSESIDLLCEIVNRTEDYIHIKHCLSKSFLKAVEKEQNRLIKEENYRATLN